MQAKPVLKQLETLLEHAVVTQLRRTIRGDVAKPLRLLCEKNRKNIFSNVKKLTVAPDGGAVECRKIRLNQCSFVLLVIRLTDREKLQHDCTVILDLISNYSEGVRKCKCIDWLVWKG
jgi:hypothetical protein